MTAYHELERRFARIDAIGNALGILQWDSQTMMPPGANDSRGEQTATLEVLAHELMTAPEMAELLDAAEADQSGLDDWQLANLREMRRTHRHETAVPADLVEANSKAVTRCEMTWRTARADSDFQALLPSLSEVLSCQRRIAEAKGEALGISPYDALLDAFEPDGRSTDIDAVFDDLAGFLPDFTVEVIARQAAELPVHPLNGPFATEAQRGLGRRLMQAAGFDFNRGRLDVSLHPFCGGATDDVRLTTRYDEGDFTSALMGVLHETGHALYEQGRPQEWRAQPVGKPRSMSIHESQSLLVEMQASRSPEFLTFLAPLARDTFGGHGPAWEAENFQRLYTRVERGFIRVDADEVTYPAHVILRYRLETALIAGDMSLDDLPQAWNEGMRQLLGIVPPNDRLGCLQDIHWPGGAWGYFPTYTLGALAAAQLFEAARQADADVMPGIARGDFGPLIAWLRTNIHAKGSLDSTDALLTQATGEPLGTAAFKAHLRRRYLDGTAG